MTAVQVDGPDLAAVARALKGASPEALKIMRQHLRSAAKPALAAERAAVQELTMSTAVTQRSGVLRRKTTTVTEGTGTSRGSGASQREAAILAKRKSVVGFAKAKKAAAKRSGLRSSIARGMRITYADSAKSAGVKVRTSGTSLPADQRGLAKAMNTGKWRHPVFNGKGEPRAQWSWVEQRVNRPQWWDDTAAAQQPQVSAEMAKALNEWATLVAALTQKAAG